MGDINEVEKVEEIRAATRDANETLQDLRTVLREIREERKAIAVIISSIPDRLVEKRIEDAVVRGLEDMGEQIKEAMAISVAKVGREFDRLEAIFTGIDPASKRAGKPPLEELIKAQSEYKGINL